MVFGVTLVEEVQKSTFMGFFSSLFLNHLPLKGWVRTGWMGGTARNQLPFPVSDQIQPAQGSNAMSSRKYKVPFNA
jgi:hypothetical protein